MHNASPSHRPSNPERLNSSAVPGRAQEAGGETSVGRFRVLGEVSTPARGWGDLEAVFEVGDRVLTVRGCLTSGYRGWGPSLGDPGDSGDVDFELRATWWAPVDDEDLEPDWDGSSGFDPCVELEADAARRVESVFGEAFFAQLEVA